MVRVSQYQPFFWAHFNLRFKQSIYFKRLLWRTFVSQILSQKLKFGFRKTASLTSRKCHPAPFWARNSTSEVLATMWITYKSVLISFLLLVHGPLLLSDCVLDVDGRGLGTLLQLVIVAVCHEAHHVCVGRLVYWLCLWDPLHTVNFSLLLDGHCLTLQVLDLGVHYLWLVSGCRH